MGHKIKEGTPRARRIAWLLAHPEKWEGWRRRGDRRHTMLLEDMINAGLYSRMTNPIDIKLATLIDAARRARHQEYTARVRKSMGGKSGGIGAVAKTGRVGKKSGAA